MIPPLLSYIPKITLDISTTLFGPAATCISGGRQAILGLLLIFSPSQPPLIAAKLLLVVSIVLEALVLVLVPNGSYVALLLILLVVNVRLLFPILLTLTELAF